MRSSLDIGKAPEEGDEFGGHRECGWLDCKQMATVGFFCEVWVAGHNRKVGLKLGLCGPHHAVVADPCPKCGGIVPLGCETCDSHGWVGREGVHLQLDKALIDAAREGLANR